MEPRHEDPITLGGDWYVPTLAEFVYRSAILFEFDGYILRIPRLLATKVGNGNLGKCKCESPHAPKYA